MRSETVMQACGASGIPTAYFEWPEGTAPDLPWAVYYPVGDETLFADGRRYAVVTRWCVELASRIGDAHAQEAMGAALASAFGGYTVDCDYDRGEGCIVSEYEFTTCEPVK